MPPQASEPQPRPVETSPLLQNKKQPTAMPGAQQKEPSTVNTDVRSATADASSTATPQPFSAHPPLKASTTYSWTSPAGLPLRSTDDENLLIFRRAVGINSDRASPIPASSSDDDDGIEKGRRRAVGIYRSVIRSQRSKRTAHHALGALLYASHFLQIVLAAVLTALGPKARDYEVVITVLGAVNTVVAGVLAVLKGSGMVERLARDEVEFRKLQDWIEETEALLSVGVVGRNRKEVGVLVEVAFKKYNACFGQAYEIMSSSDVGGGGRDSLGRDADAERRR